MQETEALACYNLAAGFGFHCLHHEATMLPDVHIVPVESDDGAERRLTQCQHGSIESKDWTGRGAASTAHRLKLQIAQHQQHFTCSCLSAVYLTFWTFLRLSEVVHA